MPPPRGGIRPLAVAAASLAGGLLALGGAARRYLDVVEIRGGSMAPSLLPGDWLVVERWSYRHRPPRPGEIALAADPRDAGRELIKRVVSASDGRVQLRGDAAGASTDSRTFGELPLDAIRWRALWRYWPPRRIGRV